MLAIILVISGIDVLLQYQWTLYTVRMQVNVFFMVLALHILLKARRHPIEQKNDSTLKASIELGRLVLIAYQQRLHISK